MKYVIRCSLKSNEMKEIAKMIRLFCLRYSRSIRCSLLLAVLAVCLLILHNAMNLLQFDNGLGRLVSAVDTEMHEELYAEVACDQECSRFRLLMSQWASSKPKAAFYYLAKSQRFAMLTASLVSVYNYFQKNFSYPVIIFHERDFDLSLQTLLRSKIVHMDVFFQQVTFKFPRHINVSEVVFNIDCASHISYRHMCQFQAKEIYKHPIIEGLEFVWRLDDDSELISAIEFDVFAFMRDSGLKYGYVKIHQDALECTYGLWQAAERYIRLKRIKPTFFAEWIDPMIYYNNFEVSALSIWLSQDFTDFINFIDNLGGIYYHRWGDAPIKSIAVSMFVPKNCTHIFRIGYKHGQFVTNGSFSSF